LILENNKIEHEGIHDLSEALQQNTVDNSQSYEDFTCLIIYCRNFPY